MKLMRRVRLKLSNNIINVINRHSTSRKMFYKISMCKLYKLQLNYIKKMLRKLFFVQGFSPVGTLTDISISSTSFMCLLEVSLPPTHQFYQICQKAKKAMQVFEIGEEFPSISTGIRIFVTEQCLKLKAIVKVDHEFPVIVFL